MTSFLDKFIKDYRNKKVLIMGLGLQGRGVQDAAFFCSIGTKVTVTDLKTEEQLKPSLEKLKNLPINYIFGQHREEDILQADMILRNADVPLNSPFLTLAQNHHIPVEMDEGLFAKYAPVKLIGITGTRGKSTTTSLVYKIMQEAHLSVWLGGNVVGLATLPLLQKVKENDWVVLELSSWQLQGFEEAKISPHISLITNIYEDHLNRYESMRDYINDKKAIFKYQGSKDYLVLNEESVALREMAAETKSQIRWFNKNNIIPTWQLRLKGEHNRSNVAAAIKVAEILGVSQQVCQKVCEQFAGLPYRLETTATINGVEYVNDTTSTTPASGVAAISSFKKPIVLIAGGNSKRLKMDPFAKIIAQKVDKVILLKGTETDNLEHLVQIYGGEDKIVGKFNDLKRAVIKAKDLAHTGDVILFSPGCTSFGMFKNEFDRGDQFNQIVKSFT